jgi:hypothetical protein
MLDYLNIITLATKGIPQAFCKIVPRRGWAMNRITAAGSGSYSNG